MRKIYLSSFFLETVLGVFWTCWVANFLARGANFSEACLIAAGWFLGIGLFEVPTGVIADRYGRKLSTVAGVLGLSGSFMLLALNLPETLSVIVLVVAGISATLISGAKDAWFFSEARERMPSFHKEHYWLNMQVVGRLGMILGAFGGAWLTLKQPAAVWLLAGGLGLLSALVAMAIPDKHALTQRKVVSPTSTRRLSISPALWLLLIGGVFFGLEAGIRNVVYQPYVIKLNGGDIMYLAYFQVSLALVRTVGILVYKYAGVRFNKGPAFAAMGLAAFALGEVVAAHTNSYWVMLTFYGFGVFCLGWVFPIRQTMLNDQIPESDRATLMSLDSMAGSVASAVACLGLAATSGSDYRSYWMVGAIFIVFSMVFILGAGKAEPIEDTQSVPN